MANSLQYESSPYLLQHAHNPVNWMAWSESSLQKARQEDKLLIVSIGYSTCHWCHVMERESFEDEEVAVVMNRSYVSVKIDREEHPEIDQHYMSSCQLMTGSGGWPLNVICLPDGRAVYAGTYYRKEKWLQLLIHIDQLFRNERTVLIEQAKALEEGIQELDRIQIPDTALNLSAENGDTAFQRWKEKYDPVNGGRIGAPKFIMPGQYLWLLDYHLLSRNQEALEHLEHSLQKIGSGGIRDHVRGGFARYSVDASWHVPHFEKMLYDNAQLLLLYSRTYSLRKNPFYYQICLELVGWLEREMTSTEGVFFSAQDADSDGEEGKYAVWTLNEIQDILGNEAAFFCHCYSIESEGNWEEGKNVLRLSNPLEVLSAQYQCTIPDLLKKLESCHQRLRNFQDKHRTAPLTDDKTLVGWNMMMISALAEASSHCSKKEWLEVACRCYAQIRISNYRSGSWLRTYKNKTAKIKAVLEDYAFAIRAAIDLFQITGMRSYLEDAEESTIYVNEHFSDEQGELYYSSEEIVNSHIRRRRDLEDNVIPSANAIMAVNLSILADLCGKDSYLQRAEKMLAYKASDALQHPAYYFSWNQIQLILHYGWNSIVIIGKDHDAVYSRLSHPYRALSLWYSASTSAEYPYIARDKGKDDQCLIYVCKNKNCAAAQTNPEEVIKELWPD